MKAVRFFAREDLRLVNIPEPEPGPGEVKIRIARCGICGSDLQEYSHGPTGLPTRPHPVTKKMIPDITLGHEFSGEIVEAGEGVEGFRRGDRVTVRPSTPCRRCSFCRTGRPGQCSAPSFMGMFADGGLAEYVVAPVDNLLKLPGDVSFDAAAFCEPLAVAVRAVRRGNIRLGSAVAITGAGTIGLLALQVALAAGAARVFVVEPIAWKRQLALELGATAAFDPVNQKPAAEISKLTEGLRADVTMECSGSASAMLISPSLTMRGGTIVAVGIMVGSCQFPFETILMREQTIVPSLTYEFEFPTALELLAKGKVRVEPLVTGIVSLDEAIEKGFKVLAGPERGNHIKVLVSANG